MSRSARALRGRLLRDATVKRWKLVALVVLVAPTAGWFGRHYIRPKMKASAQILVQESVKINPFLKDMMVKWTVKSRLPVITSLLKSRLSLHRVLEKMGDISPGDEDTEVEEKIRQFRREIDVFGEGGGLIRISLVGTDPERIFAGLKLLTDVIIEEMLAPQKRGLESSVRFLESELNRVKTELETVEGEIEQFKTQHASELPEVHKINLDNHLKLMSNLFETEASLAAAEQRMRVTKNRLARMMKVEPQSDEITGAEEKLKKAKATLAGLRGKYTNLHPAVKHQRAVVARLEEKVEAAKADVKVRHTGDLAVIGDVELDVRADVAGRTGPEVVVKGRDALTGEILTYRAAVNDSEALRYKRDLLEKRVATSMRRVKSFAAHELTLNRLIRTQQTKSKTYLNLLERYEGARLARDLAIRDESRQVYMVEEPVRPTHKRYHVAVILLAGLLGGILLAVGLVLVAEFFDRTVRLPEEVEGTTGLPVIGVLVAHVEAQER